MSIIAHCNVCHNWDRNQSARFQDERYGKGKRVHIEGVGKARAGKKRCTVCGTDSTM